MLWRRLHAAEYRDKLWRLRESVHGRQGLHQRRLQLLEWDEQLPRIHEPLLSTRVSMLSDSVLSHQARAAAARSAVVRDRFAVLVVLTAARMATFVPQARRSACGDMEGVTQGTRSS